MLHLFALSEVKNMMLKLIPQIIEAGPIVFDTKATFKVAGIYGGQRHSQWTRNYYVDLCEKNIRLSWALSSLNNLLTFFHQFLSLLLNCY